MRQYGCDLYKISQEIKRINWFSVEKLIIEREKTLYYNYKKVKFCFFITKSIRKFLLLHLWFKRNIRIFLFSCLASSFLKYKKLFKLSTRKLRFLKYQELIKRGYISFFELLKLISEIKEVFKGFCFLRYKTVPFTKI